MTIKELQVIMERAKKEADEFYEKQLEKERRKDNSECRKELDKIRNEVYELNHKSGFYGMADMEYDEFLEVMNGYSFEERMKIAYAFFLHIKILDNIVFDLRREKHENIRS